MVYPGGPPEGVGPGRGAGAEPGLFGDGSAAKGLYVDAAGRPPKVCVFNVGASSIGFGGVSGAELIGGKLWPVPMPPMGLVWGVVGTELAGGGRLGLLRAAFW